MTADRSESKPAASSAVPRVLISVAEQSADLYGANVIRAVGRLAPQVEFFGLTGPQTRAAGCESLHDMVSGSAMLLGVVKRVPEAWLLLRRLKKELVARPPAAAILIDSSTLNLRIAKICRDAGVPVLYYVAPQTWASREGRLERIKRDVNRLCVILPFEKEYFAKHGIDARFVGHPLFEALEATEPDEGRVRDYAGRGEPVVALLPGSRRQVVHEVFPGQIAVALDILKARPDAYFVVAAANPALEDEARAILAQATRARPAIPSDRFTFDCRYRHEMLLAADLALVASGTITLEAAYRATPMIVMYNHSRLFYWLVARWMILTKHLSLPNILAQRELVTEFMPYYRSHRPISKRAIEMLDNPLILESMQQSLAELVAPLVRTDVSEIVARELLDLMGQR